MSRAVNPAETPPLLCLTVVEALGLPAAAVRVPTRGGPRERAAGAARTHAPWAARIRASGAGTDARARRRRR
ncbi:hypothetical protein ACWGB8_26005 [Kitasatospora sp. NPDC054939]